MQLKNDLGPINAIRKIHGGSLNIGSSKVTRHWSKADSSKKINTSYGKANTVKIMIKWHKIEFILNLSWTLSEMSQSLK